MKIAITVTAESGRISPVFETAEKLLILLRCCSGQCRTSAEVLLPGSESEKIAFFRSSGIRLLICGAVCNETLDQLRSIGVQLIPFASGKWQDVVNAVLDQPESLPPDFIMPGCCGHHRKCCQNQGDRANENCIDQSGRNA